MRCDVCVFSKVESRKDVSINESNARCAGSYKALQDQPKSRDTGWDSNGSFHLANTQAKK